MSDEQPLNPAERELESALASLHPAPSAIDRDRMMFEAGCRSVPPQRRPIAWQALSAALAAALLVSISLHRQPRQVDRVVYIPATTTTTTAPADRNPSALTTGGWDLTAPPSVESTPPATSYLILRRRALNETDPRDTPIEQPRMQSRHLTQTRSRTNLPAGAGFFGRAGANTPNSL